jgi:high-affinity nickel-transport protein
MSADLLGLTGLVLLLGVRHGFDPDHLVAIDGLTRSTRSRWSGLFFSLGHGVVVTLVGLAVALAAAEWQAPAWLEIVGAWISISVLLVLGISNLLMTLRTPAGSRVPLVGLRARWLSDRLGQASHPMLIASVGAAFALSFDTISHALVFSLTGATMAGWLFALALGVVFTLGMVFTDALNGWWVAKMINGADRRAAAASRVMSGSICFLCLALAVAGIGKFAVPAMDAHASDMAPVISVFTVALVIAAYLAVLAFSAYRDGDSRYGTTQD